MTWINPLDKLPQLRVDWANHLCWGTFTSLACLFCVFPLMEFIAKHIGLTVPAFDHLLFAFLISLATSLMKKTVDYFKAGESLGICVAKGFLTPLFPFAFYAYTLIK
jgi:hypothetical protein